MCAITAQAICMEIAKYIQLLKKQVIGLAIGSSLRIVVFSFIIFLQCKKTLPLYHCLCNCVRHSEVGGVDRESPFCMSGMSNGMSMGWNSWNGQK